LAHAATFTVSGVVRDAAGAGVVGATVALAGAPRPRPRDGIYRLTLSAGAHTLVVRHAGYESATRRLDVAADTAVSTSRWRWRRCIACRRRWSCRPSAPTRARR